MDSLPSRRNPMFKIFYVYLYYETDLKNICEKENGKLCRFIYVIKRENKRHDKKEEKC
jgi:hypothetical protein